MTEYLDVCDARGEPTGEVVSRDDAHHRGIRHRTAHVWIVRPGAGGPEVLLQRRSANKESFPGRYDVSAAGHVRAGDDVSSSAVRELAEELGIAVAPDRLNYVGMIECFDDLSADGRPFLDRECCFVFVCEDPVRLEDLTLQPEEVEDAAWFDMARLRSGALLRRDLFCVSPEEFRLLADRCAQGVEREQKV